MRTDSITNTEDYIDSRDIIARIEELEAEDAIEYEDELNALKELVNNCEDYCNWKDGATLICWDCFEEYARDHAEGIGAISSDMHWPATCIDWEQAARKLQMDYKSVEFDGVEYWIK